MGGRGAWRIAHCLSPSRPRNPRCPAQESASCIRSINVGPVGMRDSLRLSEALPIPVYHFRDLLAAVTMHECHLPATLLAETRPWSTGSCRRRRPGVEHVRQPLQERRRQHPGRHAGVGYTDRDPASASRMCLGYTGSFPVSATLAPHTFGWRTQGVRHGAEVWA